MLMTIVIMNMHFGAHVQGSPAYDIEPLNQIAESQEKKRMHGLVVDGKVQGVMIAFSLVRVKSPLRTGKLSGQEKWMEL